MYYLFPSFKMKNNNYVLFGLKSRMSVKIIEIIFYNDILLMSMYIYARYACDYAKLFCTLYYQKHCYYIIAVLLSQKLYHVHT